MVPRGEVAVVVAGLGLASGAIDGEIDSVVVGMAIVTTLVVPPLLPLLIRRSHGQPTARSPRDAEPAAGHAPLVRRLAPDLVEDLAHPLWLRQIDVVPGTLDPDESPAGADLSRKLGRLSQRLKEPVAD